MTWMTVAVFLAAALAIHVVLLAVRPGPRGTAALGYAAWLLAVLAIAATAAAWHVAEQTRIDALVERGEMDRSFVRLKREIDAARDMACNTPSPKSADLAVLTAYTRMRTTCAYYMTVFIEAGRATDLAGVLAAAEKPWPPAGSPKVQLWTYEPLKTDADEVEALLVFPKAPATALERRLAAALPLVLAALMAVSLSAITAVVLRSSDACRRATPVG